jgi:uncharacterized protein YndB with AHSA1/START domain
MPEKLILTVQIDINAPVQKVWEALINPDLIKEYLFGTHTESNWEKGSFITYTGTWNGQEYKDKGIIIDIIPGKLLHTTYFSSMSGKEDKPENYVNVIYTLNADNGYTHISLSQDNIDNEKQLEHLTSNWNMVLEGMKKVAEKQLQ